MSGHRAPWNDLLRAALAVSILAAVTNPAMAQNSPIVRVTATPEVARVGEALTLQVTVLAPTWFPRPPGYPSFELANAITRLPPDSSFPTNERIDGGTWSGIIRRYQIHPLLAATYRLADRTMTVTYAHPQTFRPHTVEVELPDIEFRAVVPPGAEGLDPYLAGRNLKLQRDIGGDLTGLQVGDALVIRHTALLDGMPAMFLPPLSGAVIPGVSVYADEPVVEDSPTGDFPARRSERLTLVFAAAGDFTVPGLALEWWNTTTREIETAATPAFTVSVAGPIAGSPETTVATVGSRRASLMIVIVLVAGLVLAVLAGVRWAPRLRDRLTAWQQRRRRSEAYAFADLRNALQTGDPGVAHRAWLVWLSRLDPGTDTRQFARRYGDADLEAQTEQLSRSLYSQMDSSADFRCLEKSLVFARRLCLHKLDHGEPGLLPPLNP